ncbi:MAG: CAAX prenyl protease-related protein [Planctomycetia bacterium]|nr:CAAX prenyl protease-related protein [Planctomycetia bacterium]
MKLTKNPDTLSIAALVLPFVLFLLLTSMEPTPEKEGFFGLLPYSSYPWVYTIKILLCAALSGVGFFFWRRFFPLKFTTATISAIFLGALGTLLWVGICKLQMLWQLPTIGEFSRSAFNPFEHLQGSAAWAFWCVRMVGLALIVPLVEEIFLRGFLLRFMEGENWKELPVGTHSRTSWIVVIVYAALTHPAEMYAAVLWFGLVTLFVQRTKNIWDAVALHATTNLLLGLYVLRSGEWFFM